jgi:beta-N-acetylhexosaminidase
MSIRKIGSYLILIVILTSFLPFHAVYAVPGLAQSTEDQFIQNLINNMDPDEKVGQLFLLSFQETDVGEDSQIYDLITNHHIGGVVLLRSNDNFTDEALVQQTHTMISAMQTNEWNDSQESFTDLSTRLVVKNNHIPLFVGISQEGNSYPYDNIINGVTQLPNQMAIGATWNLNNAQAVGKIMGQELSQMGFNLYFGPSLDVLDLPYVEGGDDLGTRTFGGDPYWVGQMGKAYVTGLHSGSNNKMAVIAKHFPGRGSSDRLPEEEVATVRKSLEQLKQIELAPFFTVTENSPGQMDTIDGLLMSHIRYQGFQGNIRATTRPVSFDQAAQEQLMSLPELRSWRNEGGVVISDNLGSLAVRKFFDPTGENFDPRQIARNAFLSGNDLLYFDLYVDTHDLDPYSTILRVLESFSLKYREDTAFAQKVDASLYRILKLKYRMYPNFDLDEILTDPDNLENIGNQQEIGSTIANEAAVLMSPDVQELSAIMPLPPQQNESIIFFTDQLSSQQCSTCSEQSVFSTNALRNAVLRLYGPEAGELVSASQMSSFSFELLNEYLTDPESNPTLDSTLRNANWVVFLFLKPNTETPKSMAMLNMLSTRTDLLENKKVIAFGFDSPYYLDATDISKLTAYYVLFSKTTTFVEAAARILFQEQNTMGALPVSVPGIGYNLIEATSPDPNQIIPVFFEFPFSTETNATGTPQARLIPEFELGETVAIRTGVIYDHNRNPVPDGTVVRFLFSSEGSGTSPQQMETTTINGIGRIAYRVQSTGIIDIRVTSDPALNSQVLNIEVPETEGAEATIVVLQTQQPTETDAPPTPTATIEPTAIPVINQDQMDVKPDVLDWVFMVIVIGLSTLAIFFGFKNQIPIRWVLRWALLALNGGVLAFTIISIQIALNAPWLEQIKTADMIAITFAGVLFGWLVGWAWYASNQWKVNRQR